MSQTLFNTRQTENVAALSGIGSAAGATMDIILSDINTLFANATSAPTASVLMKRDSNGNTQVNNLIENFATIATAGGTTNFTFSTPYFTQFTGSLAQTIVLPNATTLMAGESFLISNRSTGSLTVNTFGGSLLQTMTTITDLLVTCINVGTSAGTWDVNYTQSTVPIPGTSGQLLTSNGPTVLPTFQPLSASSFPAQINEKYNLGISVTATSNVLTLNLTQSDGVTAPSTGGNSVFIGMRSITATSGGINVRSVTSSLSQNLSAGTTLGLFDNVDLWFYLIDSDGTGANMKLGLSTGIWGENSLQSAIAESATITNVANGSFTTFTSANHGLNNCDAVTLTTTGSLPNGFLTNTLYYVGNSTTNTFSLAITPGGTAELASTTGTGTQTWHCGDQRLVSSGTYTNVPIRIIGKASLTLSTPGNWVAPTFVELTNMVKTGDIGEVKHYSSLQPPAGFLLTNGNQISRITYSKLFGIIGTTFGVGDGSTTFAVPNTQGIWIRGAGSQTISALTYTGTLGTLQNDTTKKNGLAAASANSFTGITLAGYNGTGTNQGLIAQGFAGITLSTGGGVNDTAALTDPSHSHTITISAGDAETRPANIALWGIIKY